MDGLDELGDYFGGHLGKSGALFASEDTFVAVSEFVENASVLGVEECGGNGVVGELRHQSLAVHCYALVCGQRVWERVLGDG